MNSTKVSEALLDILTAAARNNVTITELTLRERDFLQVADDLCIDDPEALWRIVFRQRWKYTLDTPNAATKDTEIVRRRVPNSFQFAGPTGMVTIKCSTS